MKILELFLQSIGGLVLSTCVATFWGPGPPQAATEPRGEQTEAIERAALDYVEGFYEGDAERVARGVHPSLQKVIVGGGSGRREVLEYMDCLTLVEYARLGVGKKIAEQRNVSVAVLDVFENTAVVRIDSVDFIDHAQIVKINGEWRVINVLWTTRGPEQEAAATPEVEQAIEQAGIDYVGGFYARDPERMERALHPRLQKVTLQKLPNDREIFYYSTADGLVEYVRSDSGADSNAESEVAVTLHDVLGGVATIRIDSPDFVDFAHVARLNGEWRIVNVLWAPQKG